MSLLILVRHGESEWNAGNRLTGQAEAALTERGVRQSLEVGRQLQNVDISQAFISTLSRTARTLEGIQAVRPADRQIPVIRDNALDERNFGVLTGRDKTELLHGMGAVAYEEMLTGWDVVPDGGESLRVVYERMSVFYERVIAPCLQSGGNVLVISHSHALRALTIYLENIPPAEVISIKYENAQAVTYRYDEDADIISKILS